MRLYGSLTNRIMETIKPATPVVGMGATILYYSDRRAATIVEVSKNKKTVVVQRDYAQRTDNFGMTDSGQCYAYSPNPYTEKQTFTLRKNGTYVRQGDALRNGAILRIGERDEHHDFSF